jgi:DivIVA domain-containing protein
MAEPFMTALRGYDMAQVDTVLQQADEALESGSDTLRASAREVLQDVRFKLRLRGYARHQVDRAVRERLNQLTRGSAG